MRGPRAIPDQGASQANAGGPAGRTRVELGEVLLVQGRSLGDWGLKAQVSRAELVGQVGGGQD